MYRDRQTQKDNSAFQLIREYAEHPGDVREEEVICLVKNQSMFFDKKEMILRDDKVFLWTCTFLPFLNLKTLVHP